MGRKPDYVLKLTMKEGEARNTRCGVAWGNSQGWLQIVLDPGIVLHWNDNYYINLYPLNKEES